MWKIFIVPALAGLSTLMTGCLSTDVEIIEPIDLGKKTMAVPVGSYKLVGALKKALREDGWKVVSVDQDKLVTHGKETKTGDGVTTYSETGVKRNEAYSLCVIFDSDRNAVMLDGEPVWHFSITITNNQTGEEAVTLNGFDQQCTIIKKFKDALHGIDGD